MTKNRGGKRPGAGPKRTSYLYETQLMAARLGDRRLMDEADRLRAEAEAAGQVFSSISRPQLRMSPTLPPENSPEKGDPAPRKHSESAHSGADSQHSDRKYRSSKFAQQLHGPVGAEVVPESAIFPHGSAADSEAIERRRVAAAERQRRHRHRMAHALCAWKIDVDIIAIDPLIERGPLSEQDVDNRHAIELALSRLVADALKLKFGSYVLDSPSVVLVNTPEPPVKSAKRRKQVLQKNPKNNPNN